MPLVTVADQDWIDRVGEVPGAELISWDLSGPCPRADEVEMVVAPYTLSADGFDNLASLPRLRGFQLLSAGFEHAIPFVPQGVQLCNARGVHAAATAEMALTLTLAAQRNVAWFLCGHREQHWQDKHFEPGLADHRVLVVGYGDIGQAIVRRLLPFECEVTVVASRARGGDDLVPRVHGIDELADLLPRHDVVILILPHTDATDRLLDADMLARMPQGALLVNVARGRVVDTDALVAATASGRIRAALDVVDPEPLPDGHPLWSTPGVLIAPHVGGMADGFWSRATALIRRQVGHLVAGEPLDNGVDLDR
ncbi:2-hydroxyacid dehydrogenase [Arsenicicoccus sp. oral taxon 190]|uniref:2-hydroxyacid dehydrogenase n=1 Tax=Arsenicicoccus sp. oral taxon 190 TaxID=1658671 RepID=UPI00067A1342|nr:2-hydroxyacid dehydrogenase [Arsenicicoccus sp. oral taxon 190]AKT52320.1 hypothetical protein ADJ73_15430 [Arsenicicoccus sp. oral taxon 190]